jgi:peptidoglycan/LPS O-acetylase OafA/YrhL
MSRSNNFDLIRLFAALQVVVWHLRHYQDLTVPQQPIFDIIKYFPGVVVFFVISGFLIFASFDRNSDLVQYYKNRLLRIFPALWVAFFITFALVYSAGYSAGSPLASLKWMAAQLTVFQNYLPAGIKAYTNHPPNPSLWTIPIEFTFYVFVPVLFWFIKKTKVISMTALIVIFIVLSYALNYFLLTIRGVNKPLFSALDKNLFPYLFYFLLGALSYLHFDKLKRLYNGKGFYWLAFYLIYVFVVGAYLDLYEQEYYVNGFGLIGVIILSQAVISLAYTFPNVSRSLLKGNDISYGVYLYHMIIISLFNRNGYNADNSTFFPVLLLTIVTAFLSWIFVEKPALTLKNKSFPRISLVKR